MLKVRKDIFTYLTWEQNQFTGQSKITHGVPHIPRPTPPARQQKVKQQLQNLYITEALNKMSEVIEPLVNLTIPNFAN